MQKTVILLFCGFCLNISESTLSKWWNEGYVVINMTNTEEVHFYRCVILPLTRPHTLLFPLLGHCSLFNNHLSHISKEIKELHIELTEWARVIETQMTNLWRWWSALLICHQGILKKRSQVSLRQLLLLLLYLLLLGKYFA